MNAFSKCVTVLAGVVAMSLFHGGKAQAFGTVTTGSSSSVTAGDCTLSEQSHYYGFAGLSQVTINLASPDDDVDVFYGRVTTVSPLNDFMNLTSESFLKEALEEPYLSGDFACNLQNVVIESYTYDGTVYSDGTEAAFIFTGTEYSSTYSSYPTTKYRWTAIITSDGPTGAPVVTLTKVDITGNRAPEIAGTFDLSVNVPENTTAVADIQTTDDTDSEGSGLTYTFINQNNFGADNGKFNLSSTGVITFKSAPDFENPTDVANNISAANDNEYNVQVMVTDSGTPGLTDQQYIRVHVTNVVTETGSITIVKNTSPVVAGDGTFTFASSAAELDGTSITTTGNTGTSTPVTLSAASITITEDEQSGWTLDTIACSGDTGVVYDVPNRMATIDLDAGENVICTFTNARAANASTEFEANKDTIKAIVQEEALRGVRSAVAGNIQMTRNTRDRFIRNRAQHEPDGTVSRQADVPFDIDGFLVLSGGNLSTKGTFYGLSGGAQGSRTQLFFGDFDIQRDSDGSVSARINGKVAWERQVSETTLLGYFLGAELGRATLKGAFVGDQDSFGASAGAYFVTEFKPNLYFDGFASLGFGRNNLALDNGTLSVASNYTTRTGTVGASLTGIVPGNGFEFWPQMQVAYGRTHIGGMNFTGAAYGLVDNTLFLDAGFVSLANVSFTSEFKVPLDGSSVSSSLSLLSTALHATCEQTRASIVTNDCGGGVELGIAIRSEDRMNNLIARTMMERIGRTTRTSLQLNWEQRF